MARKTPLCMSSYKHLFNSTRVPASPLDVAKVYEPAKHEHVVVVRKNKFYEVPVVDEKGEWLSERELETYVLAFSDPLLYEQVLTTFDRAGFSSRSSSSPARRQRRILSVLSQRLTVTCGPRCVASSPRILLNSLLTPLLLFQARKDLVEHDPKNLTSLERIESAIIVISLDSTAPITREESAWALWVGDGKDRWFDKHQRALFFLLRSFPSSVPTFLFPSLVRSQSSFSRTASRVSTASTLSWMARPPPASTTGSSALSTRARSNSAPPAALRPPSRPSRRSPSPFPPLSPPPSRRP